jgi:tetrahydromethanopterin S-methyltransferase subunit A
MMKDPEPKLKKPVSALQSAMRLLGKRIHARNGEENLRVVRLFYLLGRVADIATGNSVLRALQRLRGKAPWPVVSGKYVVGNRNSSIAVCTLNSKEMMAEIASLEGVAIAGCLHVANLGIERIIANIVANSSIRFLLICGRESTLFRPAEALVRLFERGVTSENRIVGAEGHYPVLRNLAREQIERFRAQVELIDLQGEQDLRLITESIDALRVRKTEWFPRAQTFAAAGEAPSRRSPSVDFVSLPLGGKRELLEYDTSGFFVVSLDRGKNQIVLHHYYPDHSPAHEIRGKSADAILRAALREQLVSQINHAGYLGGELAKAEAALRLDLGYEQDQPLRRR